MPRIMAIDYGTKRVGIAVTDPLQIIATPLTTVHSKDALEFIKDYIAREDVECIVVGKPLQLDGSDSESAGNVEAFINLLKKHLPDMKLERVDERFTSKMAQRTLIDSGVKKNKRKDKSLLDTISAALILQTFLENKR